MREIKFRAKVKERSPRYNKGEWAYGYYEENPLHDVIVRKNMTSLSHDVVDKHTLGQYTGLKDKNGVEIYEGDILKIKMEDDWQELPYIVQSVLELGSFLRTEDVDHYYCVTDYYIIGNIHDKENQNE